MIAWTRQILEKIENYPIKPWQLISWFYFVTLLRNLLESLTDNNGQVLPFKPFFLHYPAFYFSVFLTIIIIFYLLLRGDIYKITKTVLLFSFFIWLAPLVDILNPLFSNMSYAIVTNWKQIPEIIFTIGLGQTYLQGASLGIKTELIFSFIGVFSYLILKKASILKAIFGSLVVYLILVIYGSLPTFYNLIYQKLGIEFKYSSDLLGLTLILITLFLILIIFYFQDKNKFYLWFKSIDWFRTTIVWLILILGIGFYWQQRINPAELAAHPALYLIKIITVLAVGFLIWQIARIINDFADFKFGSSKNLLKQLGQEDLINILIIYLVSFSILSLFISYGFFVILAVCLSLSYFYSVKPIHLKRHFILSSLTSGFAYLLTFWAGYVTFFTAGDSLYLLPTKFNFLLLIIAVLAISFKDIKDENSDRQQNVTTLVTLLGLKRAAVVINILILICALLPAWFFKNFWLVIPGVLSYLIIFYVTVGFKKIDNKKIILLILAFYIISVILIFDLTEIEYQFGEINLNQDAGWHPQMAHEIWFLSSLVADENKNQYYLSQTYNPKVGSFLTLIRLEDNKQFKEFFPNDNNLAVTKHQFNLNQPLDFYYDSNQIKARDNFSYLVQSAFANGRLRFNLTNQKPPTVLTLTESGKINLKNQNEIYYYAFPAFTVDGKIVFKEERLARVTGEAWLEHLWGDFNLDCQKWNLININLDNETKILIIAFDYGDEVLAYGTFLQNEKYSRFKKLEITPIKEWENSLTKNKWLTELKIKSLELNLVLDLRAIFPEQEITNQNIWEGLMLVSGQIANKSVSGWANFRQVKL